MQQKFGCDHADGMPIAMNMAGGCMAVLFHFIAICISLAVVPTLGVCSPVFIISGIACPLLGAFRLVSSIFSLSLPFADDMVLKGIGNPWLAFCFSIIAGVLLYLAGKACWHMLLSYFRALKELKSRLLSD